MTLVNVSFFTPIATSTESTFMRFPHKISRLGPHKAHCCTAVLYNVQYCTDASTSATHYTKVHLSLALGGIVLEPVKIRPVKFSDEDALVIGCL